MEIIFKSNKSRKEIFLRLFLIAIVPTFIFILAIGLMDNMSKEYFIYVAPYLAILCLIGFSIFSFFPRRYYIVLITLNEDYLYVDYLKWFKLHKISINKSTLSIQFSGLRGTQQYFEIMDDKNRKVKQAPYLEWQMNMIFKVKDKLISKGVKFNKYN